MECVCICGVVILQPFKASDLKSEFLRIVNYFMQVLHDILQTVLVLFLVALCMAQLFPSTTIHFTSPLLTQHAQVYRTCHDDSINAHTVRVH